jgi:lysozyme
MRSDEELYKALIKQIKRHEGFSSRAYNCSNGYPTIGYGSKLPLNLIEQTLVKDVSFLTEEEAEIILSYRLDGYIHDLNKSKEKILRRVYEDRKYILYNMAYQLGIRGLLNFKRMWEALDKRDYTTASNEMLDSKWAREDSPKRANELAQIMKTGKGL